MNGSPFETDAMRGEASREAPSGESSIGGVSSGGLSIGIVTLNSSYVQTALALRCLRNAAREAGFSGTWIAEYTARTPAWKIAAELMARRPRVLGFSVYIWNRAETLALIELLKKQDPKLLIVIGGPEVSFESAPPSPYVDVVIAGEGERKWVECLELWARGSLPDEATILRWNRQGTDLPHLREPPYLEEDLPGLAERLVYLETSRGCPYSCSFCLSALDEKVRFLPAAAVRSTVEMLAGAGVRRIKFLDRTFNLGKNRLRELFGWLRRFSGVEFHFEIVGDLLDEQVLADLETVPPGMFQFEIGVQSTRADTQALISRRQDNRRLFAAIARLMRDGRVHLHLDLIWGLPGETLADIRASFSEVMALAPHRLQLGFLKFLPGAPIRALIESHGYIFQDQPPYEVISHSHLSAAEVVALKRFEEVFDLYYNSGRYRFTLHRIFQVRGPWEACEDLSEYFARHGLLVPSHGQESLARYLLECARDGGWLPEAELVDLLKLDHFYHHRARRAPRFLHDGRVAESATVRERRRSDPNCSVAVFQHRVGVENGKARLEPSDVPVWYAFTYPERDGSYFFHPTVQRLD